MIELLSYSVFNRKKTEVNLLAVINTATNQEVETSHSHKDCKLKSYNIEYKLHAVAYAEKQCIEIVLRLESLVLP